MDNLDVESSRRILDCLVGEPDYLRRQRIPAKLAALYRQALCIRTLNQYFKQVARQSTAILWWLTIPDDDSDGYSD